MNNDYLLATVEGADIAVIGLGYVGLPLTIEFGKEYNVLGFDINVERVSDLQSGKDRTQEADLKGLKAAMEIKKSRLNWSFFLFRYGRFTFI